MINPAWVQRALRYEGISEIKGEDHNPEILQFWRDIKRGGIRDDETPWCAAFVGAMLEQCGIASTRFESAKSYLEWGVKLDQPAYGCIAVFGRTGGGHVGFVVGQDSFGNLRVLGGNQNDCVCIRTFPRSAALGYRFAPGFSYSTDLPFGNGLAAQSVV
jgi:uncharacterized protein (TIGR02594 family)